MNLPIFISMYEFKQFLQIVLWIAVPGTILAVLITTMVHYRRKKKDMQTEPLYGEDNFRITTMSAEAGVLPDWLASSLPDNATLLKKYEQEIRRQKEEYSKLEDDFNALEEKYTQLLNKAYHTEMATDEKLVSSLRQEIKDHKLRIAQLQQAATIKEKCGLEGIKETTQPASLQMQELLEQIKQLTAEKETFENKLSEQHFLTDALHEKKLQTSFLENQLEQRIKSFHQLEKQFEVSTNNLLQLRSKSEEYDQVIVRMKEELAGSKQGQATLQAAITAKQHTILELEESVSQEQQKVTALNNKLELSSQLLVKIYTELAKSLNNGLMQVQQNGGPGLLQEAPVVSINSLTEPEQELESVE